MAEALAAIGVVASLVQLIDVTKKMINVTNELREKSSRMLTTVKAIGTECTTLQSALTSINSWVESQAHSSAQLDSLRQTISVLSEAMEALLADLSRVNDSLRARLSFLWNDESLRLLLEEVRWQANALHLLLAALQLPVMRSNQRISTLRETASVRYSTRPGADGTESVATRSVSRATESIVSNRSFDFDDELVKSKAYRQALVAPTAAPQPRKPAPDHEVFLVPSDFCFEQEVSEPCCMTKDNLEIMSYGDYDGLQDRCSSNMPAVRSLASRFTAALPTYPNEGWDTRWRLYIYCAPCMFQNDIALSICAHVIGFNGYIRVDDRLCNCHLSSEGSLQSMRNLEELITVVNDEWQNKKDHTRSWFTSHFDISWLQRRNLLLESAADTKRLSLQTFLDQAEQDQRVAAIIVVSSVADIEQIVKRKPIADPHSIKDGVMYQLKFDGARDTWTTEIFGRI